MIDTDKDEGRTEGKWILDRSEKNPTEFLLKCGDTTITWLEPSEADARLIADAPLLLEEVKRLRKALYIEKQIVQAFYEYREDCCFDHCEAWMLKNGHRVMVKIDDDEQSEWKVEVE